MRSDDPSRWTRERLLYLTAGVIVCAVGLVLIFASR
jgi:hypothetical protein